MKDPQQIAAEAELKIFQATGTGGSEIQEIIQSAIEKAMQTWLTSGNPSDHPLPSRAAHASECILGESCPMHMPAHASEESLIRRITDYLSSGGLFNPEMMEHPKVRDLIIDCRDAIEKFNAAHAGEQDEEYEIRVVRPSLGISMPKSHKKWKTPPVAK